KYKNLFQGTNSRLDEIQAAMLSVKLKHLDTETAHRRKVADAYIQGINNTAVTLPLTLNASPLTRENHVWHVFVIRCEQREALQKHLLGHSIQSLIDYPIPPHQQQAYTEWNISSSTVSELLHQKVMSLPMRPTVTDEQVAQVIAAIHTFKISNYSLR